MAVYIKDVERADANYAVGVWNKEWGGREGCDWWTDRGERSV